MTDLTRIQRHRRIVFSAGNILHGTRPTGSRLDAREVASAVATMQSTGADLNHRDVVHHSVSVPRLLFQPRRVSGVDGKSSKSVKQRVPLEQEDSLSTDGNERVERIRNKKLKITATAYNPSMRGETTMPRLPN